MPWFIKAINSLRSKIGADGQNPIVFELWVIMADRKLVARSHSERFPPRQPETPKHDSRCKEDLVFRNGKPISIHARSGRISDCSLTLNIR